MAIQSFQDPQLEVFFTTGKAPKKAGWISLRKIVLRKLDILDYAHELDDLKSPPGNRLEALKGKLKGFYSIRINDQWRIVFQWTTQGPAEVKIMDYHS
jgi:proteic killer suppression protein